MRSRVVARSGVERRLGPELGLARNKAVRHSAVCRHRAAAAAMVMTTVTTATPVPALPGAPWPSLLLLLLLLLDRVRGFPGEGPTGACMPFPRQEFGGPLAAAACDVSHSASLGRFVIE